MNSIPNPPPRRNPPPTLTRTVRWALLVLLQASGFFTLTAAPKSETPPLESLEFRKHETQTPFPLSQFAGEIVVLDFFAYWCGPCKRASKEIEQGIHRYYQTRGGNPHGVPVRVVSVNIEQAKPELTRKFISETGMETVVDDPGGALLQKLGGPGTPFILILDGTGSTREKPRFKLIHRKAGFEGTQRLRTLIDAIKPPPTAKGPGTAGDDILTMPTGPPTETGVELSLDSLTSPDLAILAGSVGLNHKTPTTDLRVGYALTAFGIDYEPFASFDFLGYSQRREQTRKSGQLSIQRKLGERVTLSAAASAYDGFTDVRSLWIATYYEQQFGFLPDYTAPEPSGFNATGGARWEYLPATGFVEAHFSYGADTIAPGYELEPATAHLNRGRTRLHTHAPSLRFENLLTGRLRLLNEFQLGFTSGRDPRYSWRGALNAAIAERWVARLSGGWVHEDPTLTASHLGLTLEFDLTPSWKLNLFALRYVDTGEIENSAYLSTAAPGVETLQAGLGVRYVTESTAFSLAASPVRSDYEPAGPGTRPFANLYDDRTWLSVQAAWSFRF